MPELSNKQIERNFAEINPPLSQAEALQEANRCLYCFDAPCTHACPTHIDVPAFIKKIASGNLLGSARVIFDANPIGASCARVCPVEVLCEGACVEKTLVKKPIEIGRLQRYATDFAIENQKQIFQKGAANSKSVGIVGSGPAGLSCAAYLARLGYAVTVYEKKPLAGGLDTYGMAEYKMSQRDSLAEVNQILQLGVKFELNCEIGKDVSFEELQSRHDALLLAVGLGATNKLTLTSDNLALVTDALDFIERIKTRDWQSIPLGKTVVVIGAGNTAIDAVTQAKRLGAEKVIMVYRRTEKDISAYEYEYELAKKDAVEFIWQAAPIGIISVGNAIKALQCEKTDGSNRLFDVPCDMIIAAIGQQKQTALLQEFKINLDEKGRVAISETMQTSNPKIFAAGDCVNGGAEAVDASQMGKRAAQGIHFSLFGEKISLAGI